MSTAPAPVAMVIARFAPAIGGTENQCRQLSKALVAFGRPVTVLTERFDPTLPAAEVLEGFSIERFATRAGPFANTLAFAWALHRWLRRHPETALLHAHMIAGPALAALLVGHLHGKPVIVKSAGAGPTGDIGTSQARSIGQLKLALFRWLARCVTCPSPLTLAELKAIGLKEERIRLIPNGVDIDAFRPPTPSERLLARQNIKASSEKRLALYVGRWAPGKGVETLLSLWDHTTSDFPWQLCLVVDREPTPEEKARLSKLGNRVILAPRTKDPRAYYHAADIAVLLSENEGISNFLIEAMASQLPILTTPAAAVRPETECDAFGWLTPAAQWEPAAERLERIAQRPDELQAKGMAARETALRFFAIRSIAAAYDDLYQEVLR